MTLKTTSDLSLAIAKDRFSRGTLWRFPARVPLLLLVTGLCLQMPAVWAQQQETPGKAAIPQESPFGTYGSFEKLLQAAQGGDADAQVKVSLCYGKGIGVTQDYEKAFTWAMKAAEQENAGGASIVAGCYLQGKGVEQNIPQAIEWVTKAANRGDVMAQYNLAATYYEGLYGIPKDEEKAFFWAEKAANQGDREAQCLLGVCYLTGKGVTKNLEKSAYWSQKASDQGAPAAQRNMGIFYAMGLGGLKKDVNKALELWKKAAEAGDSEAQYALGSCYAGDVEYYDPDKIYQNMPEAKKWLQKAADQGHERAKETLERLFHIKASS